MKELILELASYAAPSGTESNIQEALLKHVRDVADEAFVDTLGNVIATKHGHGPHVVLAAHADEAGIMAIHIDESGYIRIISVGDVKPASLIGRHVQFTQGITGVVGVEDKVKLQDLAMDHLYVDIGAADESEANAKVRIGDEAVVLEPVVQLGDTRLAGRALDNRVGCAIAIEAFKRAAADGAHVSVVFTAQQAVGARGAKTAAFRLHPDLALIVDAVPAGDMPSAPRMELKLGKGPAVKIMDGTAVVPLDVKNHLIDSAAQAGIDVQYEVWPRGLSDAGAIQLSTDGIPVGGVSYPARYLGGPSTVVDLNDASDCANLIVAAIRNKMAAQ
ncbi:peptidase M42 [Alicyclobacillus tolerans]|uniref:peptidase M42 n=1 Tax=Alicyclobacillus tolerans TaxID=90970 RepID=UPI001F280EEA|nr:peptidase M42 [Alicyclobacillus tolerans]MCF8563757.1 peptidase M42 [Alicyclobacillus tolerans]